MKFLERNKDYIRKHFFMNEATGELWRFYRKTGPNSQGGQWRQTNAKPTNRGYLRVKLFDKSVQAHQVVWMLANDTLPETIDHIDHNKANNHPSNLRAATRKQNLQYKGLKVNNTTGFPGVVRSGKRFIAQIKANQEPKHLGTFDTAEEAYKAYYKEAQAAYGEFVPPYLL